MSFFKGKIVLVTGHTGFKGSWLCAWLSYLGAKVVGVSDDLVSSPSNYVASSISKYMHDYRVDVLNIKKLKSIMHEAQPDFVFHLAAQALVRPSYQNPLETLATNAIGTANVLEAVRSLNKKMVVVMITSDKAYDNVEWVWGYRETDRLGGRDPYSASKGMAELAIRSYIESFFNDSDSDARIGIARAGNVIGGGDWAQDRVVPDCMKAWANNQVVEIRSPHATRPWQHVLEPLIGYLTLAENLAKDKKNHGQAYNFGPSADQNHSVGGLISEMSKYWNQVRWNDVSEVEHLHEAGLLKLNCDKALFDLNWKPTLQFEETVKMTVEWYRQYYQTPEDSMYEYTISQINTYSNIAKSRNIFWACDD